MFTLTKKVLLAAPMLFLSVETQAPAAGLYNSYSTDSAKTTIYSSTCGSTPGSSGCYGGATLGPFGHACAMVATGVAKTRQPNGSTTYFRRLVIMDRGAVTGAPVKLYFYRETHTVTQTFATPQTSLVKTLTLPLIGGPSASCSMAHNAAGFYVGTDQSARPVLVSNAFAVTTLGGFSPPIPVVSITAMLDGHVAITYQGDNFAGGSYIYRNDGSLDQDGGSEEFLVGTQNAVTIPGGPGSSSASAASSRTLLDAQSRPLTSGGKSVVRDSVGAIVRDSAGHYVHR